MTTIMIVEKARTDLLDHIKYYMRRVRAFLDTDDERLATAENEEVLIECVEMPDSLYLDVEVDNSYLDVEDEVSESREVIAYNIDEDGKLWLEVVGGVELTEGDLTLNDLEKLGLYFDNELADLYGTDIAE